MTGTLAAVSILAVPVLLAVTIHEVAHGWVADKLGDPTARLAGRLTLNPLKHLDLVGTLVFFLTRMIGWAKPVPVNPENFARPRQDMVWVAAAGPAANFVLAGFFAVLYHLFVGSFSYAPGMIIKPLVLIARAGVLINIGLACFNILPVPPLDGGRITAGLLPAHLAGQYERLTPYGFILLLILIFSGVVAKIIFPLILFLARILLGEL